MEQTKSEMPQGVIVDFDNPPQSVIRYVFGEPVVRDNFTYFLIDSFAKSRGNSSVQAYYWKWLSRHLRVSIPTVVGTFIDKKGLSCLTNEERSIIQASYQSVEKHEPVQKLQDREEKPFPSIFSEQLNDVLKICENGGGMIYFGPLRYNIANIDESVLALKKSDFLKWLTTDGQTTKLVL
jgi:hypothetical protein